ncbi:MAG: TPP-binding protein [Ilumatobacter sp.]|nr:TPP-binding protein [Ilumatobacter sp.]
MTASVAQYVVDALRLAGLDTLFCLPGVQNDDFFDALVDAGDLLPIVSRHEQGAAYMAMGAAHVTGRPAACCVVPGPGMLNAAAALSSAYWSNARVLAVIGEIPTAVRGRGFGVLHELPDQHAILEQVTKHATVITDPTTALTDLQRALDELVGGRPRPVSIEVPVDRWRTPVGGELQAPSPSTPAIDQDALDRALAAIERAERPMMIVGGGAQDASEAIVALAELLQTPVTTRRMGHGVVPTAHELFVPLTVGHQLWAETDLVIAVGTRLEWPLLQWGVDDDLTIVKIDVDADELDRHGVGAIGVHGDAASVTRALTDALSPTGRRPSRADEVAALRADFERRVEHLRPQRDFVEAIRDVLPDDGVFVEDVTQIGFAAHLLFDFRRPRTLLSTGPAGTLGAGYAHGLGAQVALDADGGRKALVVAGDGGFLFTGNELATAVQHQIPLVCAVFDDGAFGNVKRMQQQKFGDDRTIASTLHNPDFAAYAESFGAIGLHADSPDGLRKRLDEAFAADAPVIVHVETTAMPDPWPFFIRQRVRGGA